MLGLAKKRIWKSNPMKFSYDAVIIGGGLHGLATAYYLARNHGMQDVAVIEKRFIGFGGAGRNTAIVRANQRTQYNVPLYKEALDLWPVLTKELDFNLMFNNCGNLNLMHSEAAMKAAQIRLRPILMTALAFVIGLIPLVIASGAGANARRSLGTTVVGGLAVATVLIIFVPIFYYAIQRFRERKSPQQDADVAPEGGNVTTKGDAKA